MTHRKTTFGLPFLIAGLFCFANPFPPLAAAQPPQGSTGTASVPAGVERVTSVEGITEYRLANGLQGAAVPGSDEADHHGQHHLSRRLGARELRRDGHGAPARAPRVQGHAEASRTFRRSSPRTARGRTARPGPIAPTTSRRLPPPTTTCEWALDLEVGPHGQLVHREERPRQRDDRRPQRVRGGREQSVPACSASGRWRRRISGTTTARPPSARDPTSRTCRSTGCRRSTRRYYQPDNAVLLVAGKFDEPKTLALVHKHFRAYSASDAHARTHLHGRADAGRRALRHAAARRRYAAGRSRVPRARRARTRISPPSTSFRKCSATRRPAGCTRRWSRRRRPAASFGFGFQWREPTITMFGAEVRRRHAARRRARHAAGDRRGPRCRHRPRRRKSSARAHSCSRTSIWTSIARTGSA